MYVFISSFLLNDFSSKNLDNPPARYDPTTQQWSSVREMYHPRSNFGIEIIDDMIFAIGGFNGLATIAHTECYDADRNQWLEATDMTVNRSALTANVVSGLPNVRDYTHQDRQRLMEERRQRVMQDQPQPAAVAAAAAIAADVRVAAADVVAIAVTASVPVVDSLAVGSNAAQDVSHPEW